MVISVATASVPSEPTTSRIGSNRGAIEDTGSPALHAPQRSYPAEFLFAWGRSGTNRWGAPLQQLGQLALGALPRRPALDALLREPRHRPVVEHHRETKHVILRRAVAERVRAGGVRAYVPADRAEVAARGIGAEAQPMRGHRALNAGMDRSRLDADQAPRRIHFEDAVHVGGEVEDDAGAKRLTREARAAASRRDRDALGVRVLNRPRHVLGGPRRDDRQGLPPEDARGRGK